MMISRPRLWRANTKLLKWYVNEKDKTFTSDLELAETLFFQIKTNYNLIKAPMIQGRQKQIRISWDDFKVRLISAIEIDKI